MVPGRGERNKNKKNKINGTIPSKVNMTTSELHPSSSTLSHNFREFFEIMSRNVPSPLQELTRDGRSCW
jgi:hypothetical protein